MSSWYDKVAKLGLPKRVYSEFIFEPVFVCGNRFVGKSRIIQELLEEEPEYCHASMIDYNNFITTYRNDHLKIVEHMLTKRTSNMIYEHSVLCVIVNSIVERYESSIMLMPPLSPQLSHRFHMDEKNLVNFVNDCRNAVSKLMLDRTVIVLINVVAQFYRSFKNYLPYLYLQILGYVSMIAETQGCSTRIKFIVAYDPMDLDETLTHLGVYKMLFESVSPLNKCVDIVSAPSTASLQLKSASTVTPTTNRHLDSDANQHDETTLDAEICRLELANGEDTNQQKIAEERYKSLMNRFRRRAKDTLFKQHRCEIMTKDIL